MESKGRVIVIGGYPQAGKTTLSVMLVKSGKGFSKYSLDHLSGGLNKFPEIIMNDRFNREEVAAKLFEFVKSLLESLVGDAEI